MTNPTIYSGSERILRAGVFCTLLDLTLTAFQLGGRFMLATLMDGGEEA